MCFLCIDKLIILIRSMTSFYTLSEDQPTAVQYLSTDVLEMIFPESPVITKILSNACYEGIVQKVDMQNTQISIIEANAFIYCSQLTEIIFSITLKEIGENAFARTSLHTIKIPQNVEKMTGSSWNQITNLSAFSVDKENKYFSSENGCLFNSDKSKLIKVPNNISKCEEIPNFKHLTTIGTYAFTLCPLTQFIGEQSLKVIEDSAFHVLSYLTLIDITYTQVTSLPTNFVRTIPNLLFVKSPFVLNEIKSTAFVQVYKLKKIILFSHLQIIQDNIFKNCSSIISIIYYGITDFSQVNLVYGLTDPPLFQVYTTKYYQSSYFGFIPVQLLSKTCQFPFIFKITPFKLLIYIFILT